MAKLLKGREAASAIDKKTRERTEALKGRGITPTIAILRIGENPSDEAYENSAIRRCEKLGLEARRIHLPHDAALEDVLRAVISINGDAGIHGALLLRPFPKGMDENAICGSLDPKKDIDGVTPGSLAGVFTGNGVGYAPCTAQACMEILEYYGIRVSGSRAVVIGRSLVIGRPLAMLLMRKDATVTICHTKTKDIKKLAGEADILVAAAGSPGMVRDGFMRTGQIVLDVGINFDKDGNMCGDVNAEDAASTVDAFTPVPGGVGAVTVALLLANTVDAAEKSAL